MVITYYGVTCFKIQSGETVLAADPYSKEAGLTPPRFQTDIVLSTRHHPLAAHIEPLTGNPFVIAEAGEYEIKNISIEGITEHEHTLYVVEWENMRLCFLGALSEKNLPEATVERIGTPDILFLPVGGGNALDAEDAIRVMNSIEPRIVIPSYYAIPGFSGAPLAPVKTFLTEVGSSPAPEDKLTIKAKDVPQEDTKIVVLHPIAGK